LDHLLFFRCKFTLLHVHVAFRPAKLLLFFDIRKCARIKNEKKCIFEQKRKKYQISIINYQLFFVPYVPIMDYFLSARHDAFLCHFA